VGVSAELRTVVTSSSARAVGLRVIFVHKNLFVYNDRANCAIGSLLARDVFTARGRQCMEEDTLVCKT
jgi:hypothetical protein